ncbi:hypothetical protein ACWEN6_25230 [Sphaerisporangium sp. NPDC004334]
MSKQVRYLQIAVILAGFAFLVLAMVQMASFEPNGFDTRFSWQCEKAQEEEQENGSTQCDGSSGNPLYEAGSELADLQRPLVFGLVGVGLEVAAVAIVAGVRRS